MNNDLAFEKKNNYLLVSLADKIITVNRASEILARIGEQCSMLNFDKVLLDERTVQRREVSPPEIMKLSQEMPHHGLEQVYIAFLCQPQLINKDSDLLSIFTYTTEYIVKHFCDESAALNWLKIN